MTGDEATTLFHLRRLWADAYCIAVSDGVWRASRVYDATKMVTADSAQELLIEIQADYSAWLSALRTVAMP